MDRVLGGRVRGPRVRPLLLVLGGLTGAFSFVQGAGTFRLLVRTHAPPTLDPVTTLTQTPLLPQWLLLSPVFFVATLTLAVLVGRRTGPAVGLLSTTAVFVGLVFGSLAGTQTGLSAHFDASVLGYGVPLGLFVGLVGIGLAALAQWTYGTSQRRQLLVTVGYTASFVVGVVALAYLAGRVEGPLGLSLLFVGVGTVSLLALTLAYLLVYQGGYTALARVV